jgi:hypothetical protein
MSGIANEWPTMPGNVATLATCCKLASSRNEGRSVSSAYTIPSTCIMPVFGTRQRTSSIGSSGTVRPA